MARGVPHRLGGVDTDQPRLSVQGYASRRFYEAQGKPKNRGADNWLEDHSKFCDAGARGLASFLSELRDS